MPCLLNIYYSRNHMERLRELLEKGEDPNMDPNVRDYKERTPLHKAVMRCELYPDETDEILLEVQELINFGANVDFKDKDGCTPLHYAVICRNCRLIETLLELGAQVNAISKTNFHALHYATKIEFFPREERSYKSYDPELGVVKILLRKNPNVDFQNEKDETPLMFAVQYDNYLIVRELLKNGASVVLYDKNGSYAMHYALDRDEVNVNVVVELARHGGAFEVIDNKDKTPVTCYLERLAIYPPTTEVDDTILLFKHFILQGYYFTRRYDLSLLQKIHGANRYLNLENVLNLCRMDIRKMDNTDLDQDWSVLKAVEFTINYGNENDIPFVVFYKLIKKLLKEKYPRYTEIIVSGIRRSYLNQKFAEMCCNRETDISFFEFEELFSISKYLTNQEMLFMMSACLKERPATGWSRSSRLLRCSIS